jgi:hypothetical protein
MEIENGAARRAQALTFGHDRSFLTVIPSGILDILFDGSAAWRTDRQSTCGAQPVGDIEQVVTAWAGHRVLQLDAGLAGFQGRGHTNVAILFAFGRRLACGWRGRCMLVASVAFVALFKHHAALRTRIRIGRHFSSAVWALEHELIVAGLARQLVFLHGGATARAKSLPTGRTFFAANGDFFATARARHREVQTALRADHVIFPKSSATIGAQELELRATVGTCAGLFIQHVAAFRA